MKKDQPVNRKQLLREQMRLTRPPRMQGKVHKAHLKQSHKPQGR